LLAGVLFASTRYNGGPNPGTQGGGIGPRESDMANREQRKNKEKKKPKSDKNKKGVAPASAFSAQAPGMGKQQNPQQPKK
jgi:hypothetical protein